MVRSLITPVETLEEPAVPLTADDEDDLIVVRTPEGGLLLSTTDEQRDLSASSDGVVCRNRPCGIHDISVSPSREFLATGGKNTNDVAVYRLPSVESYFIGCVRIFVCLGRLVLQELWLLGALRLGIFSSMAG